MIAMSAMALYVWCPARIDWVDGVLMKHFVNAKLAASTWCQSLRVAR